MILSVSRRTDIPNFYSDWFYNRVKEGYVLVRNPMNIHQISKINISKEMVDCIVFWTKNPMPMMERIHEIKEYSYYFQFTLNAYGKDVEPNVPSKKDVMIPAFIDLSNRLGKDKVIWRYDPIFINEKYTLEYHIKYFEILANKLHKYTPKCTVSFIDEYKNTTQNTKALNITSLKTEDKIKVIEKFSEIALRYDLKLDTCAESNNFEKYGVAHAHCIDKTQIERITGYNLDLKKDKNQRLECGCVASIDIGMYNTCQNGCLYCYANFHDNVVKDNFKKHKKDAALLIGDVEEIDIVKERKVASSKNRQIGFI